MEAHVYSHSTLWTAYLRIAEFCGFFGPPLLLIAALVWLIRSRSVAAAFCFFGSILLMAAYVAHRFAEPNFVTLPYPQPVIGQNPYVLFAALYAERISYGTLALAVLIHAARLPRLTIGSSDRRGAASVGQGEGR